MRFLNALKKLDVLFPFIRMLVANNTIVARIKNIDEEKVDAVYQYIEKDKKYSAEQIKPYYEQTVEIKKVLEDKAKVSVVGISICASIVLGLLGYFLSIQFNMKLLGFWGGVIICVSCLLVIYFGASVILALVALGSKNIIYGLSPRDCFRSQEERAKTLTLSTEQNVNYNIIRQNYVYASYRCLMYAICTLGVLFLLLLLKPVNNSDKEERILEACTKGTLLLEKNVQTNSAINNQLESFARDMDINKKTVSEINRKINKIENKVTLLEEAVSEKAIVNISAETEERDETSKP